MHKKSKRNLSSTLIILQNKLTPTQIEKKQFDGTGEKQSNSSSITYLNLFTIVWMTFMLFI
jgi:hypothetical protein